MQHKTISNSTKIRWIWPYQKVWVKSFGLQKESTQTELRNLSYEQKKFEYRSVSIQILKISKHVQVVLLDRGDHNEEVGVGFVGFGQTSKSCEGFKIKD